MDLLIFALFNAIWATLYLEHWKRRSSKLAYEWGTLDKKDELLEDPRPLFTVSKACALQLFKDFLVLLQG